MIRTLIRGATLLLFVPIASAAGGLGAAQAAATCTPTGFVRDSMNLTAAIINPTSPVKGQVDATGCNIGVYYSPSSPGGRVTRADVFGANYYGVVNNGSEVDVTESSIHDIGESPLNGDQHGVAVYFAFDNPSTGSIRDNLIYNYQKGGIVVNGPGSEADVTGNAVLGQGPVNYIAQNGIQFGYGSTGEARDNFVYGNSYTGGNFASSGGILVVGGAGYGSPTTNNVHVQDNVLVGNDVGVCFSNVDASFNPPATPTNDVAVNNDIRDSAVNNTTGFGAADAYQAGISEEGNGDRLAHNDIDGLGYTPVTPPPHIYCIDDTLTTSPIERDNSCPGSHSGEGEDSRSASSVSLHRAAHNRLSELRQQSIVR